MNTQRRNARGVLAYTFLAQAGRALWAGDVLSAYVFLVTGSATAVGVLTGVRGIAQVLLAPACGYAADSAPRHVLLRLGSAVGLVAAAVSALAVGLGGGFGALCAAMLLWGAYWAITNPAIDALFADSVDDGERSLWFTRKAQLMQLGNAAGPLASLAIFLLCGDEWTLSACSLNLLGGLLLTLLPHALLWRLRDARGAEAGCGGAAESTRAAYLAQPLLLAQPTAAGGPPSRVAEERSGMPPLPSSSSASSSEPPPSTPASASPSSSSLAPASPPASCCGGRLRLMPALVLAYDVLGALASGMSVRFFPIFLLRELRLPPAAVSAVGLAALLGVAAASGLAQKLGRRLGRVPAVLMLQVSGCGCFFLMTALYEAAPQNTSQDQRGAFFLRTALYEAAPQTESPAALLRGEANVGAYAGVGRGVRLWLLLVAFLLRAALMKCTGGLTKSILHDLVPPSQRARYASMDTINQGTWAGSAALGGLLIDRRGIGAAFNLTAAAQLCAALPLLLGHLLGLVPAEAEGRGRDEEAAHGGSGAQPAEQAGAPGSDGGRHGYVAPVLPAPTAELDALMRRSGGRYADGSSEADGGAHTPAGEPAPRGAAEAPAACDGARSARPPRRRGEGGADADDGCSSDGGAPSSASSC